ncbi:MAG TPA: hypothetical protein VNO52_11590 [Methylomirabilota bacterium]|nr:hypothetical protein [Methylomirabilota bacterium]
MQLAHLPSIRPLRRLLGLFRAFTVVDLMVASSLAVICLGGMLSLVMQVGTEQRRIVGDGLVQQEGGLLQDKLSVLIRSMSNSEGVIFGDPVPSAPTFFRRIIVARGEAPDFPRESIYFNPTNRMVIHDPDRSVANDEVVLFAPNANAVVRELYFYPSLKVGAVTDSTTLNVVLEMDDDGYSGRTDGRGHITRSSIHRYFTVKMRSR